MGLLVQVPGMLLRESPQGRPQRKFSPQTSRHSLRRFRMGYPKIRGRSWRLRSRILGQTKSLMVRTGVPRFSIWLRDTTIIGRQETRLTIHGVGWPSPHGLGLDLVSEPRAPTWTGRSILSRVSSG